MVRHLNSRTDLLLLQSSLFGGAVKRHVWNQVKSRKAIVTNAATFVTAATGMMNVSVSELQQTEIDRRNAELHLTTVFEQAKPIKGISSVHFLRVKNNDIAAFVITEDGESHANQQDSSMVEEKDQTGPVTGENYEQH